MALKSKKLVQVPMGIELTNDLLELSKDTGESRAEIIRKACRYYLDSIKEKKKESIYIKGYKKIPEDTILAEASARLFSEVCDAEDW